MTVRDSFFMVFRVSRIERCIEICAVLLFKMTPASVMKGFKANGASLMSDFHRAFPKMVWLRLCQITN